MKYEVKENCVCCGACAMDCPMQCIQRKGMQFHIDARYCIGCGDCYAICPVGAIIPIKKRKEMQEEA